MTELQGVEVLTALAAIQVSADAVLLAARMVFVAGCAALFCLVALAGRR